MVLKTNQPYSMVGDNPVNLTDPLGLFASGGSGLSAFVSKTTTKGVTKTVIVVHSPSQVDTTTITSVTNKVNVTTTVSDSVTVPVYGADITVTASATVSMPTPQGTPTIDFGSDGSADVTANNVTATFTPSTEDTPGGFAASFLASNSNVSFSLGGDNVNLSYSVSVSGSSSTPPPRLTMTDLTDLAKGLLGSLKDAAETCVVEVLDVCVPTAAATA